MSTPSTSSDIRDLLGGSLEGPAEVPVRGVATIAEAGEQDIVLVHTTKYARDLVNCPARVAIVTQSVALPEAAQNTPRGARAFIRVPDAEVASIALFGAFAPVEPLPSPGVHPSAVAHASASVASSARIGALVSLGESCVVGPDAVIHAGAVIGAGATIGEGSVVGPRVVVGNRVIIGAHCVLGPGCVIGEEGFGFRFVAPQGLTRIPHLGTVILEDRVEIGANTTIDRAKTGATRIGFGTKIDNLCQIGHNVVIGKHCAISGLTGIAGSCTIGNGVVIGGAVGIADHLTIGDGAQIGAKSGLLRDVPAKARVAGLPAQDVGDTLRQVALLQTLVRHAPQIKRLLAQLEEPSAS